LFVYKKDEDAFKYIVENFNNFEIKYNYKNNLSSCLSSIKALVDLNKKNRLFILCDSMVRFDERIYDIAF
jgi:hypothetical protein